MRTVGVLAKSLQPVYAAGDCEIDLARRELRVGGSLVPIGGRAFEFLEILILSTGRVVTKDELMSRIWPGAVVMENTLQVHAGAVRRALGSYRSLLKTVSGRGYCLLGDWAIRTRGAARPPAGAQRLYVVPEPPAANFPAAVTRLVGRSAAGQRLQDLLSAYRVVTLTGPGGIGKTVLALEVARGSLGAFADGGHLVELASLTNPELLPAAVAAALGIELGGGRISAEALARAIGAKHLLLVLDNCEHLIDDAAALVETLLRLCPGIAILATSREMFRIDGEYVYRVPPLDVPGEDQMDPAQILDHSGPVLFLARASELGADFSSQTASLPTVAAICRHLDGIPLAIEFAAARSATLGIEPVAAALHDRFALLTGGRRSALPRHRTLRATLDWSYDLLAEPERLLLRRLGVFAGGFSLEAANAVGHRGQASATEIADRIADLIAKSLVTTDISAGTGYFRLLETTRVYALSKLAESGELPEFSQRHAEYYQGFLADIDNEQAKRSTPLVHIDNVRVALEWCFGGGGNPAIGVGLAAAAAPIFLAMSLLPESHRWSAEALLALDDATRGGPEEMHLQASFGVAEMQMHGESDAGRAALNRSLAIAETRGDVFTQVGMLGMLSMFYVRDGDFRTSLDYAKLSRAVEGSTDNPAALALGNSILGRALQFVGEHSASYAELDASFRYWSRAQPSEVYFGLDHHILVGIGLARSLWFQGYPAQARERAQQTVADAERKNHPASLGLALSWAPGIFLWVGDLEAADEHADWLVSHAETYSLGPYLAVGRGRKGTVAVRRGDAERGVQELRRSLEELHALRYEMLTTGFKLYLAEGLIALGEIDAALALVEETMRSVEANGDLLHMPEARRIKGRVLLAAQQPRGDDAEACFNQSLEWSRRQGARSWELRTAIDLAALKTAKGQRECARAILQPIFETFTDGWDTADLQAAASLLATL
jgi:predicted ATPase/DNA-binding winged helix-turn-helix (wHTH) protein